MAAKTDHLVEHIVKLHKKNNYEGILQEFQNITSFGTNQERTTLRSILWPVPTLQDLEILNGFIVSRGITNIYSIGCGTGLLEWLLLQTNLNQAKEYFNDAVAESEEFFKSEEVLKPEEVLTSKEDPIPEEVLTSEEVPKPGEVLTSKEVPKLEEVLTSKEDPKPEAAAIEEPSQLDMLGPIGLTLHGIEIDSQWWYSKYAPPTFLPLKFVEEDFPPKKAFGSPSDLMMFSYFNSMKAFSDYLKVFQGTYVVIIGPTQKQYCAPGPLDLKNNPELPNQDWNIILLQRFGLELFDYVAIYSKVSDFYF